MFDVASKYCFSLDKNPEKNKRCFLLLFNLEKYINGTIIEMRRLSRVRRAIKRDICKCLKSKSTRKRKSFRLTYLANDTHFYFVCIDKVYKLLSNLATELNDTDIEDLTRRLEKIFDIKTVRNHLEHIDARCLGFLSKKDEERGTRKHISDFGNFIDDNFAFDGKKFPSGKGSLSEMKKVYTHLIELLTKKYASRDPHFVWRQQSEEICKKIMQKLKKAGLFRS